MDIQTNIKLIDKIFHNKIIFEEKESISNYQIELCQNYDNMNLFCCKKKLNSNIDKSNYIKQL